MNMFMIIGAVMAVNVVGSGYHLTKPDVIHELPDTLREISGITFLDSGTFACVQDENGIVFFYDLTKDAIRRQSVFSGHGDYEGIAKAGHTLYVLRSDGMLFEIEDYQSRTFATTSRRTGVPARDNEGLCYDKRNNRLLIGCKGKPDKGPKSKRAVYGFDLKQKRLSDTPVVEIDVQELKRFARKNGCLPEGYTVKLKTSAIAIHPKTNKLFMLSAADHLLLVFDAQGNVEHVEPLDPELFNKAEGITFNDRGDMIITNEGQGKRARVVMFRYGK
ncbi:MAG: SdiA-regulated domain-containing protein [Chitinispirillaceae bacterium]|nr:SdiA-regulated domain-containing protein [Chitinispirillaceae bacterium]